MSTGTPASWSKRILILGVACAGAAGCVGSRSTPCGARVCPPGLACDQRHEECVLPIQLELCEGRPDGERCTVGEDSGYHCDLEVCILGECGDDVLDAGEECDDGLRNSDATADACRTDCRLPRCGDGFPDTGEACDQGEANSDVTPDACRRDCSLAGCGDGVRDASELCDDGNTTGGDGCSPDCASDETCGNGLPDLHLDEECDDGNETAWDGCTGCAISELQVNTYTASVQRTPALSVAGTGAFVVVWDSILQDGEGSGVFAQRYDAQARAAGAELPVYPPGAGHQEVPAVAMTASGGFVVVWQDLPSGGTHYQVLGQRFDGQGQPLGGAFAVEPAATTQQIEPAVASAADGRFLVAWTACPVMTDCFIQARLYDSQGAPAVAAFALDAATSGTQREAAVALRPDGGSSVVVWQSDGQDGGGRGVFGRRVDGAGSPVGSAFQANTYFQDDQILPAVAMGPDGAFVVVWQSDYQAGVGIDVYGQRYDRDGLALGDELLVNETVLGNQGRPAVAMGPDGSFVVVWNGAGPGDDQGVMARCFDPAGAPATADRLLNRYTPGAQDMAVVATADDGRAVVAWQSDGQDGDSSGVFAFHLAPGCAPVHRPP